MISEEGFYIRRGASKFDHSSHKSVSHFREWECAPSLLVCLLLWFKVCCCLLCRFVQQVDAKVTKLQLSSEGDEDSPKDQSPETIDMSVLHSFPLFPLLSFSPSFLSLMYNHLLLLLSIPLHCALFLSQVAGCGETVPVSGGVLS